MFMNASFMVDLHKIIIVTSKYISNAIKTGFIKGHKIRNVLSLISKSLNKIRSSFLVEGLSLESNIILIFFTFYGYDDKSHRYIFDDLMIY